MGSKFTLDWRDPLAGVLADSGKIVLLGAGSDLRADDAAGLMVCREVERALPRSQDQLTIILGETAPENFTGVIVGLRPDAVILVDAVEADQPTGTVMLFDPASLEETNLFSTHKLPAKVLLQYLTLSLPGCRILILGLQPGTVEFGKPVSDAMVRSVAGVASEFVKAFSKSR